MRDPEIDSEFLQVAPTLPHCIQRGFCYKLRGPAPPAKFRYQASVMNDEIHGIS